MGLNVSTTALSVLALKPISFKTKLLPSIVSSATRTCLYISNVSKLSDNKSLNANITFTFLHDIF